MIQEKRKKNCCGAKQRVQLARRPRSQGLELGQRDLGGLDYEGNRDGAAGGRAFPNDQACPIGVQGDRVVGTGGDGIRNPTGSIKKGWQVPVFLCSSRRPPTLSYILSIER